MLLPLILKFLAISEVATIAQAWHDVTMFIKAGVDGRAPERHIVVAAENLLHIVHTLLGRNGTAKMHGCWYSIGDESMVAQFKTATRGEHGIGNDEDFVCQVGRCDVFNFHVNGLTLLIPIIAVCRHKAIVCMVKHL